MTKEQLVESITAHYDELNALNKIDNFYDYEGDFIKLWAKMGREVLEKNISTLPGRPPGVFADGSCAWPCGETPGV